MSDDEEVVLSDDEEVVLSDDEAVVLSDDEEAPNPIQAQSSVWVQRLAGARLVPVCVAFVPAVQQVVAKKSSRSARRRRARAMNRWFSRQGMQKSKQNEAALDNGLEAEFDDNWQVDEIEDMLDCSEDEAESWPVLSTRAEVPEVKSKVSIVKMRWSDIEDMESSDGEAATTF